MINRPNILFIMSDDHAAHAISAYGSKINNTPNIDRLADEGIRLDSTFLHERAVHTKSSDDSYGSIQPHQRRKNPR
ncbi:MAG: sulfatase-like hydrolase/transferase [Chloroflexi bacterium]|nr:sulfatase-like hydrolase/transferase [Chloroflexota bacterium]MDA1282401.1 sulfatase-like hydrolase/transferase [Chloroflexota bacterium]